MSISFPVGCVMHGVGSLQVFTVPNNFNPFDHWSKPGSIWEMGLFNYGSPGKITPSGESNNQGKQEKS